VENLFALSSVLTPFALATVIGAIATGRVPVGNARGNLVTSWLNSVSVLLPGLTVSQAAAGRSTLIATIVGVAIGAVVLVPSLALLYTLVLRGRLDITAVSVEPDAQVPPARLRSRIPHLPVAGAFAGASLVAGVGLLVFADPAWAHGLGVAALLACALTVFALVATPDEKA